MLAFSQMILVWMINGVYKVSFPLRSYRFAQEGLVISTTFATNQRALAEV